MSDAHLLALAALAERLTASLREIVTFVGQPSRCARRACRRARACRAAKVDCFWRDLPLFQESVPPQLARALLARALLAQQANDEITRSPEGMRDETAPRRRLEGVR